MKNYYSIILVALLASCTANNGGFGSSGKTAERIEVLHTHIVHTRTSYSYDGTANGRFTWSTGDNIAVHRSESGYESATLTEDGCFNVHLTGSEDRDGYALYPAVIATNGAFSATSLTVRLPAEIDIPTEGMAGFAPLPMVAVNDPDEEDLFFRHVGGVIRLTLDHVPYETAMLEVSLDKPITGDFAVSGPATAIPSVAAAAGEPDLLRFNLHAPLAAAVDGYVLHIPVPVGTYGSISVSARDFSGNLLATGDSSVSMTIGRAEGVTASLPLTFDTRTLPLCIRAIRSGTVTLSNPLGLTMSYSKDNAVWTEFNADPMLIPLERGETLFLRGENPSYAVGREETGGVKSDGSMGYISDILQFTHIGFNQPCYVYGNIMSLCEGAGFQEAAPVLTDSFTFAGLFKDDAFLYAHPSLELHLPATTLSAHCYSEMFMNCTQLECAPKIPDTITTAPDFCYCEMFRGCTRLRQAPNLPATTLGRSCYAMMFDSCKELVTGPALPAVNLENCCYYRLYSDTGLTTPPALPATRMAVKCYYGMFSGTPLNIVPALPAEDLAEFCYGNMFSRCKNLTSGPASVPLDLLDHGVSQQLAGSCYQSMFNLCTNLTVAPRLPSTKLARNCYSYMFSGSGITATPELPATDLQPSCYYYMFNNCSGLTSALPLPATSLVEDCYKQMFNGCKALVTGPDIYAETIAGTNCLQHMFSGCKNLTSVKAMFLDTPGGNTPLGVDYSLEWFDGVSSTGTFYKNPAATWDTDPGFTRSITTVPTGWTITNAGE